MRLNGGSKDHKTAEIHVFSKGATNAIHSFYRG